MLRQPVITKDGSHTVSVPEMNVTYHSLHGAIQESLHVFIDAGFRYTLSNLNKLDIYIFEMGFGTGLNALLTFIETEKLNINVHYTAVELFPLQHEETNALNYCEQLQRSDLKPVFEQIHQCEWERDISITSFFTLHKVKNSLLNFNSSTSQHLIYFDAFAPSAQPELWTKEVFEKLVRMMHPGGVLITYCSKGDVRRAMQAAGFIVEKIPGPPGKREMVRCRKASEG
ncbi:tRNA (5-methylaminomethyl-2-thiouridine)(34)-methyltransferase MnmD [Terrimonas alba]|uniref:tRNA (5-methylaminomethyl-2-thiouridine)(34)-methyltransferase MnmD n=1 Tax=Terrimonas alba TaxID=3349636 RepID=UPI0035F35C2C